MELQARGANALAKRIKGRLFEEDNQNFYHEDAIRILGVIVPKKDLEKAATIIRDNPEKYRLGKEFYGK